MDNNKMSQQEPSGNTKPSVSTTKISTNQCYRWAFTLKCEPVEPYDPKFEETPARPWYAGDGIQAKDLCITLKMFCKEFYFQLEQGEEDGYLHYQGCFSLIVKHRLSEVKNMLGYNTIHLEPAQNWSKLKNYCMKHETRMDGPWSHLTNWVRTIELDQFYPWQMDVFSMIAKTCWDDRSIYWYWEPTGKTGKTSFCKWCAVHMGASIIRGGALKDIAFSLKNDTRIVIFDITRTVECRVNYEALEAVKDGMIFSAKYESHMKIFDSPHVIVFANFPPDVENLSADRWKIKLLDASNKKILDGTNIKNVNTNESCSTREG